MRDQAPGRALPARTVNACHRTWRRFVIEQSRGLEVNGIGCCARSKGYAGLERFLDAARIGQNQVRTTHQADK